jgi:hypothetical protein
MNTWPIYFAMRLPAGEAGIFDCGLVNLKQICRWLNDILNLKSNFKSEISNPKSEIMER